jgi:hypothetical protein
MVVNGVGGAPIESMNHMGWVSEISSGKVGRCFQDTRFEVGDSSKISSWHDVTIAGDFTHQYS